MTEFAPAAAVMTRAAVFVGVGGIGSIYHALRTAVPVIGAPEHLDQEYHLNRVRDLGLGVKLDWEAFHDEEAVAAAARSVLDDYDEYRARCEAFAPFVRRWDGGTAAADAIDAFFLSRERTAPVTPDRAVEEEQFVRELEVSTPPELDRARIRRMLHRGVGRGLPHQADRGQVWFDRGASWNWLNDHEPEFFERDYLALQQKRDRFFVQTNGRLRARVSKQAYRLTYTYRASPGRADGSRLLLFLPWPVASAWQTAAKLEAVKPPELAEYLLPSAGFFYGYPVAPEAGTDQELCLEYGCTLEVQAREHLAGRVEPLTPAERARWTQVSDRLSATVPVRRFLEELSLAPAAGSQEKVERIYRALSRSHRFAKTSERCQCLSCSTLQVLGQEGAHCITLTRAFIALCRIAGVPAREVTGALAGYPVDEKRYASGSRNQPLFGHTWAEVFVEDGGWIPVEFHGIVIGPQAMTADSVVDPAVRRQIEEQGAAYEDYYLGQLDCHRVTCSGSVKRIPQLLMQGTGPRGEEQWVPPPDLQYECHLTFEAV